MPAPKSMQVTVLEDLRRLQSCHGIAAAADAAQRVMVAWECGQLAMAAVGRSLVVLVGLGEHGAGVGLRLLEVAIVQGFGHLEGLCDGGWEDIIPINGPKLLMRIPGIPRPSPRCRIGNRITGMTQAEVAVEGQHAPMACQGAGTVRVLVAAGHEGALLRGLLVYEVNLMNIRLVTLQRASGHAIQPLRIVLLHMFGYIVVHYSLSSGLLAKL